MDSILQFFSRSWRAFKSLSPSKRLAILVVAAFTLIAIVAFVVFVNQKEYRTLFSNLLTEDVGKIVTVLQEKKIPHKVSPAGDSILVPAGDVSRLRLELASAGLPQGGGMGFEIFDKRSFGVTDFVQQLNYQRALQGELSRTISGLDEIQHSRVHIVIPQKSLFVEERAKPTASVAIRLKPGRRLQASQIEGIAALVAGSVEGLSPEEVMIVDSGGNILSAARGRSQLSKKTDSQIEFQRNVETSLANRIQSMLEKVAGKGNVVAKVSAVLDFRVVEKTEEFFDPEEPVIRRMHRKTEKSTMPVRGGESTVSPTGEWSPEAYGTDHEKTDEIVSYEINRVISRTVAPVGKIERLSVAVLVDGVYKKNDKGVKEFQPRSEKEIENMEDLVKSAVGFNARRGDQVTVTSVPFKKIELEIGPVEEGFWETRPHLVNTLIKYSVSLIVLILVFLFILRPLIKFIMTKDRMEAIGERRLPVPADSSVRLEDRSVLLDLEEPGDKGLKEIDAVSNLASRDARKFAELLRNWLK